MRIHYLQHVPYEGIAGIGDWATARGHTLSVSQLFAQDFAHPGAFDMLVVMGGPMNIYQDAEYPWLAEEKRFIASTIEAGKLVLGVCLGSQLVADVLGGPVTHGVQPEIGWYPVELTEAGRALEVFSALPERFEPLHWHGDTFAIPPGAVHVARSEACENQAFAYDDGRVIGLQCHLEATHQSWSVLCEACGDQLEGGGEWISSAEEMLADEARFETIRELLFGVLDAMSARHDG